MGHQTVGSFCTLSNDARSYVFQIHILYKLQRCKNLLSFCQFLPHVLQVCQVHSAVTGD